MQRDDNMSLEQYKDSPHYQKIYEQIEALGLVEHIAHLDEYGYTVIPPELLAPEAFHDRLRKAVLSVHEQRTGEKIKLEDIESTRLTKEGPGNGHWGILTDDPVFQEALMNPTVLAMAKYLCGNSVVLSDLLCIVKQQDDTLTHPLHADQHGTPPPLPPYAQVCNVTWTLTDYKKGNGPVAIVPKSHLKGRYPTIKEGNFLREDAPVKAIPIEAPAGSLIVWHGTTWHGSYPRENAGLRMNIIMVFTRVYMKQIRDFRSTIPKEFLDRHPVEFAHLIGANSMYPFEDGKPAAKEDNAYMMAAGFNPWA
jgi:ectoine hydroxylase-related dioxygenase (phytanoyl-CoA dioxygenase family)